MRDMRDGKSEGLEAAKDVPEHSHNHDLQERGLRQDAAPRTEPKANDGIDRRNFLSCMAWAGTGLLWTMVGGVPTSKLFAATADAASGRGAHGQAGSSFSFVQISDSHIGFNKAANQDVTGTLKLAIDKINGLSARPDLLLHTGDITQSSKASEFDTAQQVIRSAKAGETFYVPGEHDTATDDGALYRNGSARARLAMAGTAFNTRACTSSG